MSVANTTSEVDVQKKAVEEIDDEIEKVRKDIARERSVLKRLKSPRTTNTKIRGTVSAKRSKSKLYIDNRTEYLKELIKRRSIVSSIASTTNNLISRLRKIPESNMAVLYNQLSVNVESKEWSIETIEVELQNDQRARATIVEDVVSDFLDSYDVQSLLSKS